MLSIKARLVLLTMLSIVAIFGISGSVIYYFAQKNLIERFDQRLRVQAYSIMTATYQRKERRVVVHFTDRFLHEFNSNQKRAFYQIWKDDDAVVKRSESLGEKDLPRKFGKEREPKYWNLELPNGLRGRAIGVRYEPRIRGNQLEDYNQGFRLVLVVATDTQEMETSLASLRNLLLMGGLATLLLSPVFVIFALYSGLSPLKGLAGRMGKVDAGSLETQFDEVNLPEELRPIVGQLNKLMLRLRSSFERERQFSADVAHELRTPISAMLNIAEVGLKWKDAESKKDYEAMRSIASEMQATVTQLLDLSRCDSGELELTVEPVVIGEVVQEKWCRYESLVEERAITVNICDFGNLVWEIDRYHFERILDNLLENAANYTSPGGQIEIELLKVKSGFVIRNDCEGLVEDDLEKIYDRFWRKDNARSSSLHRGLGLSVASAFAKRLNIKLNASLSDDSHFEMGIVYSGKAEIN